MTDRIVVVHYPTIRPENWALLTEAAARQHVELITWMPHDLAVRVTDDGAVASHRAGPDRPDVLMHRTVASFQGIVVPALGLLAASGVRVVNEIGAAYRSRDKLATTLALVTAGVPVVDTLAIVEPAPGDVVPAGPVIVKPAHGVRGEGITAFPAGAELAAWRVPPPPPGVLAREHWLVQPLVDGGGRDVRAYVVGDRCVALAERRASPGEVRANLALGGTATPLPDDHPAASVAVDALAACGLDHGGVDLIDDNGFLRVLEVDAWAGFAGLTAATGRDVAGAVLDQVLRRPGQ